MGNTDSCEPRCSREELSSRLERYSNPEDKLQEVCAYLVARMENCHWAGYYLVDPDSHRQLLLGPYSGASTEHTRIAFGEGICGQAASSGKTFMIADVSAETNYLSCSPDVRSEIVVPIFLKGEIVGEIDLDSNSENGFGLEDREYLEWLASHTALMVEMVRTGEALS